MRQLTHQQLQEAVYFPTIEKGNELEIGECFIRQTVDHRRPEQRLLRLLVRLATRTVTIM